jgi:gentisate 1,2-dioxygenase
VTTRSRVPQSDEQEFDAGSGHCVDAAASFSNAVDLDRLHELLALAGMEPGWNRPTPSMWPHPRRHFAPARWRYHDARAALHAAGRLVSTDFAERRNLILFNPIDPARYATVHSLVAAYQLVLPGETARTHRHSANALRVVVDAKPGAFTVVEGCRIPLEPGDAVLTPSWSWHGHANDSNEVACWVDVLDVPTNQFFEAMFFERLEDHIQKARSIDIHSPIRFEFRKVQARLDAVAESSPGRRVVELGPPRLKTIGLFAERLDTGAGIDVGRTTASSIYVVIEGAGLTQVDGIPFGWYRGDVIVVPAWRPSSHRATQRSHLLRITDEPMLRALGWLRNAA